MSPLEALRRLPGAVDRVRFAQAKLQAALAMFEAELAPLGEAAGPLREMLLGTAAPRLIGAGSGDAVSAPLEVAAEEIRRPEVPPEQSSRLMSPKAYAARLRVTEREILDLIRCEVLGDSAVVRDPISGLRRIDPAHADGQILAAERADHSRARAAVEQLAQIARDVPPPAARVADVQIPEPNFRKPRVARQRVLERVELSEAEHAAVDQAIAAGRLQKDPGPPRFEGGMRFGGTDAGTLDVAL